MSTPEPKSLAVVMSERREWLEAPERQAELRKLLPKGMTPEAFTRIVMTAHLKTPDLIRCTPGSLWVSVMQAAQLGLPLDGRMAVLVPFKDDATCIVMYQGYVQLAYAHPRVLSVTGQWVCEKDHFEYEEGFAQKLVHVPAPSPRGEVIAAYAWAKIRGGGLTMRVLDREQIDAARARSRQRDGFGWTHFYPQMARKTAILRLASQIPQAPALMLALAWEHEPDRERPSGLPTSHANTPEQILDAIVEAGEGA